MDIQIHARNMSVNPRLEEYVEKKLNRLDRYLPNIKDVHLDLTSEHQKQGGDRAVAQLTVRNQKGVILRAEDKKQSDVFAAVDVVIDKMYRQISRYKGKRRRKTGDRFESVEPELASAEPLPISEVEESTGNVVRRKEIELIPMSEEEAIDQLELIGHDFFVFFNAAAGKINVLYRREDGNYGLLDPVVS